MDWISQHDVVAWLVLAMVLGASEMLVGEMVLLMLAGGALAAAVAAALGLGLPLSAVIGGIVAVAMLGLVRPPVLERLHRGPHLVSGAQRLVGAHGTVTALPTAAGAWGQARIGGETWSIRPEAGAAPPPVGAEVRVQAIDGATAVVRSLTPPGIYVQAERPAREDT